MTTHASGSSLANLSISGVEDWDAASSNGTVPFPATPSEEAEKRLECAPRTVDGNGRTLSQLLRLYAEKGTDVSFSQEEADAVADALGQWVSESHDIFARLQLIDVYRSTLDLHHTKTMRTLAGPGMTSHCAATLLPSIHKVGPEDKAKVWFNGMVSNRHHNTIFSPLFRHISSSLGLDSRSATVRSASRFVLLSRSLMTFMTFTTPHDIYDLTPLSV
jgi:hypothetical protein